MVADMQRRTEGDLLSVLFVSGGEVILPAGFELMRNFEGFGQN